MDRSIADRLSDLVDAVKALPEESQKALVEEFLDRLADFTDRRLSDAQRAQVDRRLAVPRRADPRDVHQFFARFGIKPT